MIDQDLELLKVSHLPRRTEGLEFRDVKFGSLCDVNRACTEWLRRRGLIVPMAVQVHATLVGMRRRRRQR